jgi:GNAT superfamily N-acetyltransferase
MVKVLVTSFKRFLLGLRRPSKATNLRLMRERGEDLNAFKIREARREELKELVDLHVTTWNDTYPYVKNKPTHQIREYQWKKMFELKEKNWFCFVVEDRHGKLVAFATGNTYEEGDLPYAGQLNKIYVLRNYQRLGLGRKLMQCVACRFKEMGVNSMLLFSEAANPSTRFYEAMGGQRLYDPKGNFHGGYGWSSLEHIINLNRRYGQ